MNFFFFPFSLLSIWKKGFFSLDSFKKKSSRIVLESRKSPFFLPFCALFNKCKSRWHRLGFGLKVRKEIILKKNWPTKLYHPKKRQVKIIRRDDVIRCTQDERWKCLVSPLTCRQGIISILRQNESRWGKSQIYLGHGQY